TGRTRIVVNASRSIGYNCMGGNARNWIAGINGARIVVIDWCARCRCWRWCRRWGWGWGWGPCRSYTYSALATVTARQRIAVIATRAVGDRRVGGLSRSWIAGINGARIVV